MGGTTLAIARRQLDSRFATTYFVGNGLDIGCGDDSLWFWKDRFPGIVACQGWDQMYGHGDAQHMDGVPDATYDFLHASHVLEHVRDPEATLRRWWEVLKPGGHLVVLVPEWEMYEHATWPSTRNPDHKTAWTINGLATAPPMVPMRSVVTAFDARHWALLKVERLDATFRPSVRPDLDQTQLGGECAIEVIARRRP
jgi:trans-aconitate methyltransferase